MLTNIPEHLNHLHALCITFHNILPSKTTLILGVQMNSLPLALHFSNYCFKFQHFLVLLYISILSGEYDNNNRGYSK